MFGNSIYLNIIHTNVHIHAKLHTGLLKGKVPALGHKYILWTQRRTTNIAAAETADLRIYQP